MLASADAELGVDLVQEWKILLGPVRRRSVFNHEERSVNATIGYSPQGTAFWADIYLAQGIWFRMGEVAVAVEELHLLPRRLEQSHLNFVKGQMIAPQGRYPVVKLLHDRIRRSRYRRRLS